MDRLTFLIGRGLKKSIYSEDSGFILQLADFSLDLDTTVSIKHARISINMNESVPKVQVCDLKSTNGTFLNSVQLESNVCVDICKNDVLQVGSTVILLKEIDNRHLKTDKDLVLGILIWQLLMTKVHKTTNFKKKQMITSPSKWKMNTSEISICVIPIWLNPKEEKMKIFMGMWLQHL